MSFFDNLAFVMGGDADITPEFRSAFAEYDTMSKSVTPMGETPQSAFDAPATMSTAPTVQPVVSGELGAGRFGGIFGGGNYPTSGFTEANPNTITTGAGGGLYGGDVGYNPTNSAYGKIDPSSYLGDKKEGATNLSAAVQRAQYQDYLNRFAPVENFLVGQVDGRNTKDLGFDVARANQSVINAGANMQGQQERAMGRFGLQYKGPSIGTSNDITGGRVAAMNQARMADEERALSLMSGSGQTAAGGR
jgi:hypothetical protein